MTAALVAQENNPPKDAATKTESAVKAPDRPQGQAERKTDSLEDFEKQLQKELETTPDRSAVPTEQPSVLWQFIRTLLTLAVLLGIFYGIFRLYRFKRELPSQNFSAVSSIYEYPLGPNQRLQIIEIAGDVYKRQCLRMKVASTARFSAKSRRQTPFSPNISGI